MEPQFSKSHFLVGCAAGVAAALTLHVLTSRASSKQRPAPEPKAPSIQVQEHFWTPRRGKARAKKDNRRNKVTVRVPATSANLGPGFDAIGMALDMWSEITVERADAFEIILEGEGADVIPKDASNLICLGVRHAFAVAVGFALCRTFLSMVLLNRRY